MHACMYNKTGPLGYMPVSSQCFMHPPVAPDPAWETRLKGVRLIMREPLYLAFQGCLPIG